MVYKNRLSRLFRKFLENLIYTRKMKHKNFIRKIRRYSNRAYIKNKSNLRKRVHSRGVHRKEIHRREVHRKEEHLNTFDERSSSYERSSSHERRSSHERSLSRKRSLSYERSSHFLTDIFIRDDFAFYPMFALLFIIALFITGYTQKYISLNMLVNQVASKEIDYDAFREMNLNEETISNIMKEIETEKNASQSNQYKESSTSNEDKDTTLASNSRIDSDIVLNIEEEDSNNKKGQVIEYANNQVVTEENNSELKKNNNTVDESVTTNEQTDSNKQTDSNNNQTKNQKADSNKASLFNNQYQKFAEKIKERNGIADLTLMMMLQNYNAVDKKRMNNSDLNYLFKMLKNNDRFKELYTYYTVMLTDLQLFPIGDSVDGENVYTFSDTWNAPRTYGGERKHEGTDIFPEENKAGYYPIVSVSDGVVEKMGWLNQGGYRIGVRSSSGAYFYYAHLDTYAPDLEIGDEVTTGQFLGYMGNSGYGKVGTKGMFEVHLHFGIYLETKNGELSVNPYRVLRYLQNKRD